MRAIFCILVFLFVISMYSAVFTVSDEASTAIKISSSNIEETSFKFTLSALEKNEVVINEEDFSILVLEDGGQTMQKGFPQLPFTQSSVIIPDASSMALTVNSARYKDYAMRIAPSKGLIKIGEDYDAIDYEFDEVYGKDEFYPKQIVANGDPYLIRNVRGMDLRIYPVQYNPVKQVVRVYSEIEFELCADGSGHVNTVQTDEREIKPSFDEIYKVHFGNYTEFINNSRYDTISDTPGKLLVVCYEDFEESMQPYVNWKRQKGIETELVMISEAGNTGNELLEYLQDYYADDDELVWVLLVGDYPLIPVIYSYDTYAGDGFFGRVAGTDPYADIIIGRFSAETEEEVDTMVERTIYHERDIDGGDWLNRAAGCAYDGMGTGMHNEGGHEHMNYIRDDLLDYGYETVDQIYESAGGTTQVLIDALNEGRGIMNYIGHGDITYYYSIPFYINDINELENNHMLPIIHNCACLVGHFAGNDCFAEAWLKAENDDGPIGAVAYLGSAESQWIGVPEYGQDEWVDLMCEDACGTVGGLWFNSICYAMEVTSEFSQLATWNLFGDPSLCIRSKEPDYMAVDYLPQILIGMNEFEISTGTENALVCLSIENEIKARGFTDASGTAILDLSELEPVPGFIDLTVTALNKVAYTGMIQLIPANGPFLYIDEYDLLAGDDELLEAGESVLMDLQICNYGSENANEINLTMNIDHENVVVTDSEEYLESLGSNETIILEDVFSFELDEMIGLGCPIQVTITMESTEGTWSKTFWLCTDAPAGLWINPADFVLEMASGDSLLEGISVLNNLDESEEFSVRLVNTNSRSIEGSTLECDTENFLPGQQQRWDFTATNLSMDNEWISGITLRFPDEVMVTDIEPFTGASGGDMTTEAEPGEGIEITWTGVSPNGWGFLHNGESAETTIEFIVNDLSIDSLYVDWELTGDGYGNAPHSESGRLYFLNPLSWIELHEIVRTVPSGAFHVFEFMVDSSGLSEGEYSCEVLLSNGEEEYIVPVELNVTLTEEDEDVLENVSFIDLNAYPNPFNPQINIDFQIKDSGFCHLKIYNIKGQCVDKLIEEYKVSGKYSITWDASDRSSGIYFIAAENNDQKEVEKILLLK